jgi:negative regulator of flagellin synthesis FlgM
MEINGTNPLIISNNNVQRLEVSPQTERAQKGGEVPSNSDRLELSVQSQQISHLEELIRSTPDVREEKVQQLQKELDSGTYNVKAEKIAEKMIGGTLLDEIF